VVGIDRGAARRNGGGEGPADLHIDTHPREPYPGSVRRWPFRVRAALATSLVLLAGCRSQSHAPASDVPTQPRLPEGDAGRVLRRAIDAEGGWERWRAVRDVSYISMLTVLDPAREVSSDSIGWFSAPLHAGALARMDSIGLPTEVQFGIDADRTWIVSEGRPVLAPGQLALTRFDLVSSLFWFTLPFRLAERAAEVTYVGRERGPDGTTWDKLRAEFPLPDPAVPGRWVVLYFDAESGLIDRVHAQLSAPFLRHDLWVGQWRHYRDCDGLRKERQRKFFPADAEGNVIGAMVAEQYVERVHFNNDFGPDHFGAPASAPPLETPESADLTAAPRGARPVAWAAPETRAP
jgi:hypothetical protein